jgi:anti-sigma regulatory factor (Ser/Thr protein kinase)
VRAHRTFPPAVASDRAARQFVLAAIGDAAADQRDLISVMVSELAMNAVDYARTPFEVSVEFSGQRLRVEVTDSGGGTVQAQPPPPASSPHGRGLFIVDELSDDWGVSPSRGATGKSVWFAVVLRAAADNSSRG